MPGICRDLGFSDIQSLGVWGSVQGQGLGNWVLIKETREAAAHHLN